MNRNSYLRTINTLCVYCSFIVKLQIQTEGGGIEGYDLGAGGGRYSGLKVPGRLDCNTVRDSTPRSTNPRGQRTEGLERVRNRRVARPSHELPRAAKLGRDNSVTLLVLRSSRVSAFPVTVW